MSGLDPQGTQVHSFKQPSAEELDHDFLWRTTKALPERGSASSTARAHRGARRARAPDAARRQKLRRNASRGTLGRAVRGHQGRASSLEKRDDHPEVLPERVPREQRRRFLERIDDPSKNWKFSSGVWSNRSSGRPITPPARTPWPRQAGITRRGNVVPADHKWFARRLVSDVVVDALEQLDLDAETHP